MYTNDNDTVGRIHSSWRDRSRVEEKDFVKLDMFFALLNEMRMMLMNQWSQSFRLPFVAPQYSWIKILGKMDWIRSVIDVWWTRTAKRTLSFLWDINVYKCDAHYIDVHPYYRLHWVHSLSKSLVNKKIKCWQQSYTFEWLLHTAASIIF